MESSKIRAVRIIPSDPSNHAYMAKVMVVYDGSETEDRLFEYFDDELTFKSDEFVGLTEQEARDLYRRKDIAYLQSP